MNIKEFEQKHDVRLISKKDSFLMKLIGIFSKRFIYDFWTTYRFPWGKPTIACPPQETRPLDRKDILEHEMMHVEDIRSLGGLLKTALLYFLLPLPIFFSGRWYVERSAYLNDIKKGRMSVDDAAEVLWSGYVLPWPKKMMKKWFNKELKK